MRLWRVGVVFGFFFTVCVLVFPNTTFAAISLKNATTSTFTASEEKQILDATVNLYCKIKVGNKEVGSTGSGVVIDSRGVILTNAHVAQYFLLDGKSSKLTANCSVRTGSPAKETYKAEVLYISNAWLKTSAEKSTKENSKGTGENDFALLYVTGDKKGNPPVLLSSIPLDVSSVVKKDDIVTAAGYPAGDMKYKEVQTKLKVFSATTTVTNTQAFETVGSSDLITLSASKLASSGVSGGPVAASGKLAGILTTMGTSKSKEGARLRAITIPYIDQAARIETGLSLGQLYSGDLKVRAGLTRTSTSKDTLSAIERMLRVAGR